MKLTARNVDWYRILLRVRHVSDDVLRRTYELVLAGIGQRYRWCVVDLAGYDIRPRDRGLRITSGGTRQRRVVGIVVALEVGYQFDRDRSHRN